MIDRHRFDAVRAKYGHYASWAVWGPDGTKPKDGMGDLSFFDHPNHELLATLNPEIVLVGLNISRAIARPFGNFHPDYSAGQDYKLRHALRGTRFWGGYITDIIKDFEAKVAGKRRAIRPWTFPLRLLPWPAPDPMPMVHSLSRLRLSALAAALALAAPACNTQRLAVRMMQPTFARMKADFEAEESPRQAREAGPALLAMMDGFLAADPENEGLLLLATEMLAGYAFAFAEEEDPAWARSLNRKALTYGTRLLDMQIEFSPNRDPRKLKALGAQLERLEKEDVPALFWTGFAYGGLINSSRDDMGAVEQLDVPLAMMNRVIALDPGFHYGGAYLFLGLYHGGRGADIGGKPEEAAKCFRKAIELSGGKFLLARVLYARYYLVGTQKREEFEKTLKEVAAAGPPADRSLVLANAVARERAAALLARADRYFGPSKAAKAAEDKTKKEMGDLEDK